MALVGYSDSEDSGVDEGKELSDKGKQDERNILKSRIPPSKPAFQKVIDRSSPHKIRVNLTGQQKELRHPSDDFDGPAAKRVKVGSGSFSDFSSFLPAPKRAGTLKAGADTEKHLKGGGLRNGINLKTGATPGFSREHMDAPLREAVEGIDTAKDYPDHQLDDSSVSLQNGQGASAGAISVPSAATEPIKKGNPMMFKPLSVARKPKKKKAATTVSAGVADPTTISESNPTPRTASKVSLFTIGVTEDPGLSSKAVRDVYEPMVYQAEAIELSEEAEDFNAESDLGYGDGEDEGTLPYGQSTTDNPPQSLDTIAADLNLSASAKRQLLGRQRNAKGGQSAVNVVNFNTDQEYANNELLRQSGEQIQHNPVRALAAGKHSLKQLINAASNQKDALEESFASGRRNKKEAGSKYGW